MYVEYDSNNSGGDWWLTDEDWKALASAGWDVDWCKDGRFLGALATSAKRHGMPLRAAVIEWERITGKCSTDAGCPCCGNPHKFTEYTEDGRYVSSGPEVEYSARWPS